MALEKMQWGDGHWNNLVQIGTQWNLLVNTTLKFMDPYNKYEQLLD
jgi:hypothetical protein